jgi:hypothetical protein
MERRVVVMWRKIFELTSIELNFTINASARDSHYEDHNKSSNHQLVAKENLILIFWGLSAKNVKYVARHVKCLKSRFSITHVYSRNFNFISSFLLSFTRLLSVVCSQIMCIMFVGYIINIKSIQAAIEANCAINKEKKSNRDEGEKRINKHEKANAPKINGNVGMKFFFFSVIISFSATKDDMNE